ncbi:MAG: 50S ribosomal protein L18a [Candidatus Bathyarchaeota archaeon]|nr:MAG: 50S ribosomal protein L18a [Candidatus Bathyarchaeota archaeon]
MLVRDGLMVKKGSKTLSKADPIRVKVFRVTGEIKKPNLQTRFRKEVREVRPEAAVERIYTELGSRHRAKRFQIKIHDITEIKPDEIEDDLIKKLTLGEEESVQ